jgi:hypothetical protein
MPRNLIAPKGQTIIKRIGRTKFIVNIHFSERAKENVNDKFLRLIKNDLLKEKIQTKI